MTREIKKVFVEKSDYIKFRTIAQKFYEGALSEIKMMRWNAAGLLIVHSAIAYADSLTVKYDGCKSKSDNHQDTVILLEQLMPTESQKNNAILQLGRLIDHKTTVAYSGDLYDKDDIDKLLKHLERFKTWVEKQY
ncbi:MAG: hypothetical protein RBS48_11615 [Ignavibacteriaceae bacterium]|jgi:hypothetical protein|nr:MAG: hypothetical protein APF79_14130 [bacterium BRH_c32]MDX9925401.1 hypothetical protein [Ignavibacteriaceae bacterium]